MTKKELKREVKFYKEQLEETNKTAVESLNRLSDMYDRQLKVQDNEIKRLNTIIHYLETKCLKVYDD